MERAQKETDLAEQSGSEDNSSSSDSDSSKSSKSSFGVNESDSEPKRKRPAAKAQAKRKSLPSSVKKESVGEAKPPANRLRKKTPQKNQSAEKLKQSLEAAEKYMQSLVELRLDTLWRSCVRAHEVDRRLSKESSVISAVDSLLDSPELPEDTRLLLFVISFLTQLVETWDFFPTCQVMLDFIRAVLLLSASVSSSSISSASSSSQSRSQWAQPDLHRELRIPVGAAGPQPRAPDPSGHCRTSTATSRSQWALPDLNRDFQVAVGTAGPQPRLPDRSGHCRTSMGRMWEKMSDRMSEDMPEHMPEDMPDRMPEDMSDRMPEDMPDRMPEDLPDRIPNRMSEDMSDRMPEDLPVRKCINAWSGSHEVKYFYLMGHPLSKIPQQQLPPRKGCLIPWPMESNVNSKYCIILPLPYKLYFIPMAIAILGHEEGSKVHNLRNQDWSEVGCQPQGVLPNASRHEVSGTCSRGFRG